MKIKNSTIYHNLHFRCCYQPEIQRVWENVTACKNR